MLGHPLFDALSDRLMPDPTHQRREVQGFHFRPAMHLDSGGIRECAYKHWFRMILGNAIAIIVKEVHPIIDMM